MVRFILSPRFGTLSAYAQDPPSLGDVARQARKDKEKNAAKPKTVITEDTLPSSKGTSGLALADLGSSQSTGDGSAMDKAVARLQEAEASLKREKRIKGTSSERSAAPEIGCWCPWRSGG